MTWSVLGILCAMLLIVAVFVRLVQSRLPLHVIPDWRSWHKMISTWVATWWAAATAYMATHPMALTDAWHSIPDDLRPDVPHWLKMMVVGFAMLASLIAARVIRQPALRPEEQKP